jgi:hypothetical protein
MFRNGRYENRRGFLVLTKGLKLDDSVLVKIGYEESRLTFPLCYIHPEMTTERPMIVSPDAAQQVISVPGERVVIIGPDITGDSNAIGCQAIIVNCPYDLLPGQACVGIITSHLHGQYRYVHEDSLCRSTVGDIDWEGIICI